METTNGFSEEIDARIILINELWVKREYDRAISECNIVIEQTHNNELYRKEMKAYNLLGMLYRGKREYQEALNQFSEAMSIAKEHDLEMSEENAAAYYYAGMLLYNAYPPIPQVVTLLEKAISIRSSIINDENDATLADYKSLLETFRRVYNL
jgi:tetratricopeptide (TPR) repeat protein